MQPDHDYEVGYGRPPVHARFRPGQSGNPKGRPKGSRNKRTAMAEQIFDTVAEDLTNKVVDLAKDLFAS